MKDGSVEAATFAARFAVENVGDSGILFDLESGGYFQLNPSATTVCTVLSEARSSEEAAARIAERLGISSLEATTAIDDVLRGAHQSARGEAPIGPFRYRKEGTTFVLAEGDRIVLEIDPGRHELSLNASPPFRYRMLEYVRAVTPKLLGLLDRTVLHASVCALEQRSLGFSGVSGAGKTTTARAFGGHGALVEAEDLVVLADDLAEPSFYREGERAAHQWAAETAAALSGGQRQVSFAPLQDAAKGPTRKLDEIWFLDLARREGSAFRRQAMNPLDGLISLLRHTFMGVSDPNRWRRHVARVRDLSTKLSLAEATVPAGVDELARAAHVYVANSAS